MLYSKLLTFAQCRSCLDYSDLLRVFLGCLSPHKETLLDPRISSCSHQCPLWSLVSEPPLRVTDLCLSSLPSSGQNVRGPVGHSSASTACPTNHLFTGELCLLFWFCCLFVLIVKKKKRIQVIRSLERKGRKKNR